MDTTTNSTVTSEKGTNDMKKFAVISLALMLVMGLSVPALATEEGHPLTPHLFDECIEVESFPAENNSLLRKSDDRFLGSYTIKQYLNDGYYKFTDQSFGKGEWPEDGTFEFFTYLKTTGSKSTIKVGIAYVNWLGDDTFFCSTTMGLSDKQIFSTDKTPKDDVKYYGSIYNRTGGQLTGSFELYAIDP